MTRKTAKRQVIGFPPDFLKDIEEVIQAHEAITGITLSRVQALKYGVSTMLMIQNGDALYQTKETVEKQMQQLCTQAAALARFIANSKGEVTNIHAVPLGVTGEIDGIPHVWQIYEQEPRQFFKIVKNYLNQWHPEIDVKPIQWHTIDDPIEGPNFGAETPDPAQREQLKLDGLRVPRH